MSLIDTVRSMKREYIRATGKVPTRLSCGSEFYAKLIEEAEPYCQHLPLMIQGIRIEPVSSHSETKCHG